MSSKKLSHTNRRLIANEAARILAEQGDLSYRQAKRKAAVHLGLGKNTPLPEDTEIEEAVKSYQQLFYQDQQPTELTKLRQIALQAMKSFQQFKPRLVGSVKSGTASQHSSVRLLLFCDAIEEVILHLINHNIPFNEQDVTCNYPGNQISRRPLISFRADDIKIELLLLPLADRRSIPFDYVTGVPDKGISLAELELLLT